MKTEAVKPKKVKTKAELKVKTDPNFDPNQHLIWSTRKIVFVVAICLAVSLIGVFGFLAVAQWGAEQIEDSPNLTGGKVKPNSKHYSNEYWGIEFDYPGSWTQPIGSYADGEYYFASAGINFIKENEPGDAIIALKTYNNWQNLGMDDWIKSQGYLFMPQGQKGSANSTTIDGMPAQRFTIKLKKPENNTSYWDMVIISRSEATKYVFILETDSEKTHDQFNSDFEYLLSSISKKKAQANGDQS